MAELYIGGKYKNEIKFRGNRKFLPVKVRRIIGTYFNRWNSLSNFADYPQLIAELGEVNAGPHLGKTDWEKLSAHYEEELRRHTVVLRGIQGENIRFGIGTLRGKLPRAVQSLLKEFADGKGVLKNSFDIWRIEKLLRRANAHITAEESFPQALQAFARDHISFEESLSFFRQLQAYHDPRYLEPVFSEILAPQIDEVHTMLEPLKVKALAAALEKAGAKVRLHESCGDVLRHELKLHQLTTGKDIPGSKQSLPKITEVLKDRLKATPYPFQVEGVAHLVGNKRALLADDMGLGKTLQSIAASLYLKETVGIQRVLIVCPSSLKYQWQSEIHRFTNFRCEVVSGDAKERKEIYKAAQSASTLGGDRPLFYVINYELVYRDIELLLKLNPDLLVLDEAQRVKNFRTKTAEAVFKFDTEYLFVLTGTPLENQLMELFTIMRFIDNRALGSNALAFRDRYVEVDRFGSITGYKRIEEVSRKIASLTLRRTKQQALDQLPDLVQHDIWLDLTDTQRQIYREMHGQARELLTDSVWDSVKAKSALTMLQRLREVCDTPELIDPQYTDSRKLSEMLEIVDDEVRSLDRQAIIFTQWTRMGEIIMRELKEKGYSASFLHGGLDAKQRSEIIERFTSGKDRIFVSTDAGGTGLNLQNASLVINYDQPFNPAKLNQRIARAHRLGQKETVFVVNLLCRNTVEDKLQKLLKEKQELFDDVFGGITDPKAQSTGKVHQRTLREMLNEVLS